MSDARGLASVACLLGDESRAAMCLAMLDGGCWTVSELAAEASVGMAAASEHVTRLAAGGLVTAEVQGRSKYVRLAGPHVAEVIEALSAFGDPQQAQSLGAVRRRRRLATARTCYDHLAGRLGVAVHDAMIDARLLHRRHGIGLTPRGRSWFADLDVDLSDLEAQRRVFVRDCLDLTERRPHLAGSLGAALCTAFLERGWVRRPDRSRALAITPTGERAVRDLLAISPADLVPS
jgi:DNA-binding transcriptional ArsR family regulator